MADSMRKIRELTVNLQVQLKMKDSQNAKLTKQVRELTQTIPKLSKKLIGYPKYGGHRTTQNGGSTVKGTNDCSNKIQ